MSESRYSKERMKEFKQVFKQLDHLKQKKIRLYDMKEAMVLLGFKPVEKDANNLIELFKGEEMLNFDMFVNIISVYLNDHDVDQELLDAFKVFDREETGTVSNERMFNALTTKGDKLTEEEAQEFIRQADPGNTGAIQYVDFINSMK